MMVSFGREVLIFMGRKVMKIFKKPAFWMVLAVFTALIAGACFLTREEQPISQDGLYEVTIRDGVADKSYNISRIYWMAYLGDAGTVTIRNTDTKQTVEVSYDLSAYTISDSAGRRTYRHCVMSTAKSEYGTVTEYFFLTDDPEMTAEKYLSGKATEPTEVLYIDRRSFDAAEIFGNVPPEIEALMAAQEGSIHSLYCPDSVFCIRYRLTMDSVQYAYVLERLDYAGKLLYSFDVKGFPQEILELEDGGFAVVTYSYEDSLYELSCYGPDGVQRWVYSFDYGESVYVPALFARNGEIYCFGEVTPKNSSSDICIWRISMDGQLVQEKHFTGSDFESIHRVEETDGGFTIYGSSQSGDGDFPFSKDGYGEYFVAQVNAELELLSAEQSDSCYGSITGYLKGTAVFDDDPILDISKKDNFPEGMLCGVSGIFDWEEGYVVVRRVYYEIYQHGDPLISRVMYYSQKIVTCYDAGGNPIWQTAGGIQVG